MKNMDDQDFLNVEDPRLEGARYASGDLSDCQEDDYVGGVVSEEDKYGGSMASLDNLGLESDLEGNYSLSSEEKPLAVDESEENDENDLDESDFSQEFTSDLDINSSEFSSELDSVDFDSLNLLNSDDDIKHGLNNEEENESNFFSSSKQPDDTFSDLETAQLDKNEKIETSILDEEVRQDDYEEDVWDSEDFTSSDTLSDFKEDGLADVEFPSFENKESFSSSQSSLGIDLFGDIPIEVSVELGRTKMSLKDVLNLTEGYIVTLDHLVGEPLDLFVNGQIVAKGEVVALDNNYGLRVTEVIVSKSLHSKQRG